MLPLSTQLDRVLRFLHSVFLNSVYWPVLETAISDWLRTIQSRQLMVVALPSRAYAAVGGYDEDVILPLDCYWILAMLAARILDDLQDGDLPLVADNGEENLPLGYGILTAANLCLSYVQSDAAMPIFQRIQNAILIGARAQAHPPTNYSLERYFENIAGASGMAFGTVAWAGARLATQDNEVLRLVHGFARYIGMRDSIRSDVRDLGIDLGRGLHSLPVIYSLAQETHPLRSRLASLLDEQERDVPAIIRVLDEMGALAWSIDIAESFQQQAVTTLEQFDPSGGCVLWQYVEHAG